MQTLLLEVVPVNNGTADDYEAFTIRSTAEGKDILNAESRKLVNGPAVDSFNEWSAGKDVAEMLSMHCGHSDCDDSADRSLLHRNPSGFDYRLSIIQAGRYSK